MRRDVARGIRPSPPGPTVRQPGSSVSKSRPIFLSRSGNAGATTIVLRKIDAAGRPVRQIELCDRHAEAVIARERKRGFEIFDRSDWVQASFEPCCAWVAHFK